MIGVISGLVLAKIISLLTGTPTAISIPAMLLAVLLSIVIGVISGVVRRKAANLNPMMRCAEIDSTMKKGSKETSFEPFLPGKIEYRSCAGGFPAKKKNLLVLTITVS